MKNLHSLLKHLEYKYIGGRSALSLVVRGLAYNSADVRRGSAFFCLEGARADGHDFALEAYGRGARIFFCERPLPIPADSVQILVKNSRKALALVSAEFFSHPEKNVTLIGITGTKGKSTVCEMICHIFAHAGKKCAVIGTLGIKIDGAEHETENSTPESYVIYKALAETAQRGIKYVAMEVSSQALCTFRVHGLHFAAAVFTNLSRDHIGAHEHPSFEHYKEAKKSLFRITELAFICADDFFAREFAAACHCPVQTYGTAASADIRAVSLLPMRRRGAFGISFSCLAGGEEAHTALPLPGDFSALNALAAMSVCLRFGVPLCVCAKALEDVRVRGRFEPVPCARQDIACIIDYAHNAVSLEKTLAALREYEPHRIICVFGSVGGRTRGRRRELAEVATRLADVCIVTSDNPDFEAPEDIIEEIAAHIPAEKCICIADRAKAVGYALELAESGDFLLFAGKGHEEYQLVRGKKLPFSERELIKNHIFSKKDIIPFP
ncbi:MAG: UDP-N-acetylmuramoyl-L-alanyl-D-glutamate--2,6-diaminopimelate ligase [Clostridia bacterium]|nr:UDP-N-acetylmuramoyl-L-alanyl-D-glutamate--2,6-diaminopimelate ligase [Clostridia bacterium]